MIVVGINAMMHLVPRNLKQGKQTTTIATTLDYTLYCSCASRRGCGRGCRQCTLPLRKGPNESKLQPSTTGTVVVYKRPFQQHKPVAVATRA